MRALHSLTNLKPRDVPWRVALRNTVAVLAPLAIGVAIGQQAAGLAATSGALNTMFSDQPGPYRLRMARMLAAATGAGLAALVGILVGASTPWALLAVAAYSLVGGMMVALGPMAARVGLTSLIVLLITADMRLPADAAPGVAFAIFCGGLLQLVFALAAWPLGMIALRLGSDYLAIVTLGFSESVRMMLQTEEWLTRGMHGLPGIPRLFAGWASPQTVDLWIMLLLLAVNAGALFLIHLVIRSPFGRVIEAVRDNEVAVRALGKNVFQYKMQALVLGGVIAAVGGIVYALPSAVSPGVYVTSLTFFVYTALLLGGAATVFGPLIGSLIFWVLQTFLSNRGLPAEGESTGMHSPGGHVPSPSATPSPGTSASPTHSGHG